MALGMAVHQIFTVFPTPPRCIRFTTPPTAITTGTVEIPIPDAKHAAQAVIAVSAYHTRFSPFSNS